MWAVLAVDPLADATGPDAWRSTARDELVRWLPQCCDGVVVVRRPEGGPGSPVVPGSLLAALVAGLREVPDDVPVVLLTDAEGLEAADPETMRGMRHRLGAHLAAVTRGAPVTDALKRVEGDRITGGVDREGLFAPRTPQLIRRAALHEALAHGGEPARDPATLLARCGLPVEVVAGQADAAAGARPSLGQDGGTTTTGAA